MAVKFENNIIKTEDFVFDEDLGGIGHIYFRYLKTYGDRNAQIDPETGETDTYSSLLRKCVRTALILKSRGIKKGDVVVLSSDHHLNACVPSIAAQFLGAIPCCICVPDCVSLLSDVKPKIIFTQKIYEDYIRTALVSYNIQAEVVVFEDNFEKEFLAPNPEEYDFEPIYITDIHETGYIVGTSGSTGPPKAVLLKHYNIITYSRSELTSKDEVAINGSTKKVVPIFLSYSKWGWISAEIALFFSTVLGGCRILSNNFSTLTFWKYVQQYKINTAFITLRKIAELYENGIPKATDISTLKYISSSGEALPEIYAMNFRKLFPDIILAQSFASTETGSISKFHFGENRQHFKYLMEKPASVGVPNKGVWCKVIDLETEKPVGHNKVGELRVKSKQNLNGYINRDMTSYYDEDGFFKTGDVVYFDEDYCFYFLQRKYEVVKYKAKNVFPSITEHLLVAHPAVKQAVVVSKSHEVDGNHLMAFVMLKKGYEEVTDEELLKFVNGAVNEQQEIRGGIIFVNTLPYLFNGKLNRMLLKRTASSDSIENLNFVHF